MSVVEREVREIVDAWLRVLTRAEGRFVPFTEGADVAAVAEADSVRWARRFLRPHSRPHEAEGGAAHAYHVATA